ncbi:hypothetical protein TcWFU_001501 [Taenia crassiceps]|uniref:Uncharacterized protein n=1 Tax=Taenia crassiceps TaxID=6207 RepID=A0ABR4QFJ9_9CEST
MLRQLLSDSLSWIPNAAPPSMFGAPLSCLEPSISETLVSMSAYIPSISSLSPIVLCFLYSASSTHFFLPFASPYLAGRQTKHWKLRHEASKSCKRTGSTCAQANKQTNSVTRSLGHLVAQSPHDLSASALHSPLSTLHSP